MYEELKKQQIIIEMQSLIKNAGECNEEIDAYCEFMRETFLGTSRLN